MGIESAISLLGPARVQLNGNGGGGALTPEMVQAGLGNLRDADGAALLLAKVQGVSGYARLESSLHARVLTLARREEWKTEKPRRIEDLTRALLRLALLEFLIPPQCSLCKGRAKRYNRATRADVDCPRCDGVGALPLSGRERARELGIAHTTWDRTWAKRYQRIQAFLSDLYGTAEGDLKRVLK